MESTKHQTHEQEHEQASMYSIVAERSESFLQTMDDPHLQTTEDSQNNSNVIVDRQTDFRFAVSDRHHHELYISVHIVPFGKRVFIRFNYELIFNLERLSQLVSVVPSDIETTVEAHFEDGTKMCFNRCNLEMFAVVMELISPFLHKCQDNFYNETQNIINSYGQSRHSQAHYQQNYANQTYTNHQHANHQHTQQHQHPSHQHYQNSRYRQPLPQPPQHREQFVDRWKHGNQVDNRQQQQQQRYQAFKELNDSQNELLDVVTSSSNAASNIDVKDVKDGKDGKDGKDVKDGKNTTRKKKDPLWKIGKSKN